MTRQSVLLTPTRKEVVRISHHHVEYFITEFVQSLLLSRQNIELPPNKNVILIFIQYSTS